MRKTLLLSVLISVAVGTHFCQAETVSSKPPNVSKKAKKGSNFEDEKKLTTEFAAVQAAEGLGKELGDAARLPPGPERDKTISEGMARVGELREQFSESSAVNNTAARAALNAGDVKTGLGWSETAIQKAREKKDDKALVQALLTNAVGNGHAGNNEAALKSAEEALKIDPKGPYAESARAIALLTRARKPLGLPSIAKEALGGYLEETSPLSDPRVKQMGVRAAGRKKAIEHLNEAKRLIGVGDARGAIRSADEAIKFDPGLADAYMWRAIAFGRLNDLQKAVQQLTVAIELWTDKDSKPAKAALEIALNERSRLHCATREHQKALSDAERVLALNPNSALGHSNRGKARRALGQKGEATLADFKRAAELDPMFAEDYKIALAGGPDIEPDSGSAPRPPRSAKPWIGLLGALAAGGFALFAFLLKKKAARAAAKVMAPGVQIGDSLKLLNMVGSGGMGEVWEAIDENLSRAVAVKIMRPELQDSPEQRADFVREAKMVASLKHPNIVAIYDAFEQDGNLFLVFEMMRGATVYDKIVDQGPLPTSECTELLKGLCAALDYAHERGIIHRDLKPNNMMLEDGIVKIMDFGIARKSATGVTVTGRNAGTPAFMAPEQEYGHVSRESDLYGLAVCLYMMLTGRMPFSGEAARGMKTEGRFDPAPPFDEFFAKALAPDRKNRFHSGAELLEAFRQACPLPS